MSEFDLDADCFQLPFPDFVRTTILWLDKWQWCQDSDAMFHFVRAIKGYSLTKQMPAEKAYATVRKAAPAHPSAAPNRALDIWSVDGEVAFHRMWERVRFPMGSSPVDVACGLAGDGVIRTQKERPGQYCRFLTVAALLQIQVRNRAILLPVRKIAAAFPCQPNSVTAWIGWAKDDGVLLRVREHVFRSSSVSQAAEYVFGLHCWGDGCQRAADLLAVNVTPADKCWTREQFEGAAKSA